MCKFLPSVLQLQLQIKPLLLHSDQYVWVPQAMAQWREEQNVAELMETFIYHEREEVKQFYPHFYHKTGAQPYQPVHGSD